MIAWLLLFGFLFLAFFPTIGSSKQIANRYIREVHPYSGLDPDTWSEFKGRIRAFEEERDTREAARHLYLAIESIRNLGLFVRRADDSHIQDELEDIAGRLGVDGEYELYTSSKKNGVYFFPRYLNETVEDPVNVESTLRGGTVGDPAFHVPAPRRGGGAVEPRNFVWGAAGHSDAIGPDGQAARPLRSG